MSQIQGGFRVALHHPRGPAGHLTMRPITEQLGVRAENPGHVSARGQNAAKIYLDLFL